MKLQHAKLCWLAGIPVVAVLVAAMAWFLVPPYRGNLQEYSAATKICDRQGRLMRVVLGRNDLLSDPIRLEQSGDWAAKALIAGEDKRFYGHSGVDVLAVCRAAWYNLISRRVVSGASTISMLVGKLTEPRPRNLWTKIVEAQHALYLEEHLTKEQILEQYLNRAPFGANIIGIEAAARRYFGKSAADMTLSEAALLVGLPQSPSRLRPDRHLALAVKRRDYILEKMQTCGFITEDQLKQALAQELPVTWHPFPFLAPHFCDLVSALHPRQPNTEHSRGKACSSLYIPWREPGLPPKAESRLSLMVNTLNHVQPLGGQTSSRVTSLDLDLQSMAEKALRARLAELKADDIRGGAIVVLDVKAGEIRAMIGSPDYTSVAYNGQVNGAVSRRSPGSALKPFVYAMAIEEGMCAPRTIVADIPVDFAGYRPENFSKDYCGPVATRDALIQSLNIPALLYVQKIGLGNVVQRLREVGLSTLDQAAEHYGLSIVIGTCEVTLLDLANAYACLARKGLYRDAACLAQAAPGREIRLFSEETAYLVADILSGEERSADAVGHIADVRLPRVAWKTGTSAGNRDAWCIAYNPEYVVGVWIGNPSGKSSPALVGSSAAAPVAHRIFRSLYPGGDAPWFARPSGLKSRQVCQTSGMLPSACCPMTIADDYIPGITACAECTVHQATADGGQVCEVWPAEVDSFLKARGLNLRQGSAGAGAGGQPLVPGKSVKIVSPSRNEIFHLLDDAPFLRQEIVLRAVASPASSGLYWFVDSQLYCQTAETAVLWPLKKGKHLVACYDSLGQGDSVDITVE